jgi:molybdate transport system substrate-binding protein
MRWGAGVLTAAAIVSATTACGATRPASGSDAGRTGGRAVTVLAAASLTGAFGDLKSALATGPEGQAVTYSFAGSQQLVAQIEAGAPADVVATADEASMGRLVAAGLVEAPRDFAVNRLAIAVRPGNPLDLRGLADLARPALRVVLADPSVPAGRYGRQALDRAGVTVKPVSLALDVEAVAAAVASGEADAGIVYATDVAPRSRVDIPEGSNVVVSYPVAVVRSTGHRAGAQAFVDALFGLAGRRALGGRGFGSP